MLTTLDRYITGHANRTIGVVVVTLLALISLFALFEEMDEGQVTYGLWDAAAYVLKTMPRRLDEILAYGLFLGYLITLGRLAESNEMTICRVSGMSPLRLCGALAPSMLLWLVIGSLVSEYIAPASERRAEVDKLEAQYGDQAQRRRELWLRMGALYMRVGAIDDAGRIYRVSQYWLDDNDALVETIEAESGSYDPILKTWELQDGMRTVIEGTQAREEPFTRRVWNNDISPDLLASQAFLDANKMSMSALSRQIELARSQRLGVSEYELAFWTRALKPLIYIGLTLFALGVVLGPLRQVGMGLRLTFGIFAGLGFKYLQDLFAPAALVFNIPALIAILMPIALYWTVAWILIRRNA